MSENRTLLLFLVVFKIANKSTDGFLNFAIKLHFGIECRIKLLILIMIVIA